VARPIENEGLFQARKSHETLWSADGAERRLVQRPAGEVLGLIGTPTARARPRLFECLGGVLPLDAGSLVHDGQPMSRPRARLDPLLSARFHLPWPAQSVRWAIELHAGVLQGPNLSAQEVVERLDIGPLLDAPIGSLSKGQRKRALLAIGLLMPQPLLLADEPFDGLDLRQSRDVAQTLRSYASAGRTMFLSIHQIKDAARVCDRFVLLSGGRIRRRGHVRPALGGRPRRAAAETGDLEEVFLALT